MRPWQSSRFAHFEVHVETTSGHRFVEHDANPESHAESSADARRRTCYIECENLDEPFRVVYTAHSAHPVDFAVDIDIDGRDIGYSRGYNAGWKGIDMFGHSVQLGENDGEMTCSDLIFQNSGARALSKSHGEIMVIIQEGIATRVPPFAPDLGDRSNGHHESRISSVLSVSHTRPFEKEYCTGFFEQSDPKDGRFILIFRYGPRRAPVMNRIESNGNAVEPSDQTASNPTRDHLSQAAEEDAAGESDEEVVEAAHALAGSSRPSRPALTARQAEIARLQARLAQLIKEEEEESRLMTTPASPAAEPPIPSAKRYRDASGEVEVEGEADDIQAEMPPKSKKNRSKRRRRK